MLKTEETEFEVVGVENNHLWLRILHGEDSGMRLSVPVRDPAHGDAVRRLLSRLDCGDFVEAVLRSEDDEYPDWKVEKVRTLPTDTGKEFVKNDEISEPQAA